MKRVLMPAIASLTIAVCALSPAAAEHGSPWVHAFPADGSELPANGRIVLISMNGQDSAMPAVGAKGLALTSDSHPTIELRVVEAHDDPDGYGEASSVLMPAKRLVAGATYELVWPNSGRSFRWTVAKRADTSHPTWKTAPVAEIAKNNDLGYPGDQLVRIVASEDTGHLAIHVTITSPNKIVRTAIWDFVDGCAFTGYLATGMTGAVRVKISLLDAAGNKTPAKRQVVLANDDASAYLCYSS